MWERHKDEQSFEFGSQNIISNVQGQKKSSDFAPHKWYIRILSYHLNWVDNYFVGYDYLVHLNSKVWLWWCRLFLFHSLEVELNEDLKEEGLALVSSW